MANRDAGVSLREWLVRLWATFRRTRSDADLEEELRLHVELASEDARRRGLAPDEAARAARLAVGGIAQAVDAERDQRGLGWLDDLGRDLRYAARTLARTRAFTVVAVLSLALGIGANTAIFTLMDAVLFRTLAVEAPNRLYFLGHDPGPQLEISANYPIYERYRTAQAFSGVTAYRSRTFRVSGPDGVERVEGQYVSGNYHAVIAPRMAIGRGLSSEPDRRAGESMIAVISYEYWMTRFGGSADAIGRPLTVDDRTVTIVGVTARGFHGLNTGAHIHLTLPISIMTIDEPGFLDATDGWTDMSVVARLAPGVTEGQAVAEADGLFQQFMQEPPNRWARRTGSDQFRAAALVPAAHGTFALRQQFAQPLWVLLAMVAVLLLVACANVAVLSLARAADRGGEIAVRLSMGAGRSRIVRQLLTESALLAVLGGAGGVVVAVWGTGAILSVFAIGPSPAAIDAVVNVRVLAATTVVILLTAIGFGLVPAFRSTSVDLAPALNHAARTIHGPRRPTLGKSLVVAQVALSLVLVAAAALLSRSLQNLQRFDAGFSRDHLLLADINVAGVRLPERRLRIYADLLERARRLPGVQSASLSWRTPIDFSSQVRRIDVPGFPPGPRNAVSSNNVTPGYFETFGLKLIRGRGFTDADRHATAPVAVVDRAVAQHFFGDADPLGRTFTLGPKAPQTTIVGVVEDARHEALRSERSPRMVYLPMSQMSTGLDETAIVPSQIAIALRTKDDPAALASSLRSELRAIDTASMVLYVRTMKQQIDATLIPEQLMTTLSTWFAAAALLLACVGLYGVMAYNVASRRREIGIRIALGALPRLILVRVLKEALIVSAIGIAIGLAIALATTRLLSTFLFDLPPRDVSTLAGTTAILLAVAFVAGFLPARRAAAVDPIAALRDS